MSKLLLAIVSLSTYIFEEFIISLHLGAKFGRWLFTRKVFIIWLSTGAIITGGFFLIAIFGPHMRSQQHILTYERKHLVLPKGSTPVETDPLWNSLNEIKSTIKYSQNDGKVFYSYYCAFCHGQDGKRAGPVGQSFVPTPPVINSARIKAMQDSVLLNMILTGEGHQNFITDIVSPEQRFAIITFIKTFK